MKIRVRVRLMRLARSLALVGISLACVAQADGIDQYAQSQLQRQHFPGLALVVIRDGRVLKMEAYGFSDIERQVPVTADTVFEIGSITKQFTAMAVMLLVEDGKLGLEDTAGKYLPDLPKAWRAVTIRQLLTHTSGVPDFEEVLGYGAYRNVWQADKVIATVARMPMAFKPGTKWKYSNTGYFVLTLILEKVSGEAYLPLLKKRVFGPLGMERTRSSEPTEIIPGRAAGYEYSKGQLENRDPLQPTIGSGAGMLVSTAKDLVKWNAALDAQSILKPGSYAKVWTDQPLADGSLSGYGFGWFVAPMRGHRTQNHSGGTAGFACNILRLPDDHLTVIALTNSYNSNPVAITNHIARLLVPDLAYPPIEEHNPEVAKMVMDLYLHRLDPEIYDKQLSAELAAKVRPYWRNGHDYYRSLGPPLEIVPVERNVGGVSGVYRYRVRYADTSRLVLVTIDKDSRIADFLGEEE
ncbi:MAG: beta-lactamase family protein [Arenimonas sp.]|nr:beta-lactamase family protein [Arenimonas sp.]MBP8098080.1 beta-lactamase family protein [Arenimonas sp.]